MFGKVRKYGDVALLIEAHFCIFEKKLVEILLGCKKDERVTKYY